jgi:hypothetical protein
MGAAMFICELTICETATVEQLKDLAETIEQWCEVEDEGYGYYASVNDQGLRDLRAGELPLPFFLEGMGLARKTNKVLRGLGRDDAQLDLGPDQAQEFKRELGPQAYDRSLRISILDGPHKEMLARLRDVVPQDVVQEIRVREVPDEDEETSD